MKVVTTEFQSVDPFNSSPPKPIPLCPSKEYLAAWNQFEPTPIQPGDWMRYLKDNNLMRHTLPNGGSLQR